MIISSLREFYLQVHHMVNSQIKLGNYPPNFLNPPPVGKISVVLPGFLFWRLPLVQLYVKNIRDSLSSEIKFSNTRLSSSGPSFLPFHVLIQMCFYVAMTHVNNYFLDEKNGIKEISQNCLNTANFRTFNLIILITSYNYTQEERNGKKVKIEILLNVFLCKIQF